MFHNKTAEVARTSAQTNVCDLATRFPDRRDHAQQREIHKLNRNCFGLITSSLTRCNQ